MKMDDFLMSTLKLKLSEEYNRLKISTRYQSEYLRSFKDAGSIARECFTDDEIRMIMNATYLAGSDIGARYFDFEGFKAKGLRYSIGAIKADYEEITQYSLKVPPVLLEINKMRYDNSIGSIAENVFLASKIREEGIEEVFESFSGVGVLSIAFMRLGGKKAIANDNSSTKTYFGGILAKLLETQVSFHTASIEDVDPNEFKGMCFSYANPASNVLQDLVIHYLIQTKSDFAAVPIRTEREKNSFYNRMFMDLERFGYDIKAYDLVREFDKKAFVGIKQK